MRCADAEREVLESGDPSAPMRAHLAGCAGCRALNEAHQAMRALGEDERPPPLPVPDLPSALARRRRRQLGLWATLGATAALAVLLAWTATAQRSALPAEDHAALQAVPPLIAWVDGMLERELGPTDFAYRPFGELAVWLAPTEDPLDDFTHTLPEEEP